MGAQGISCHQLLSDLSRERLFDTAFDVNFGKLLPFEFDVLVQLLEFAHEIRLFSVGLRADGHIFASSHRHSASHQSRDTGDQDIVLLGSSCGNADDQACGRYDTIVGPENRGSQPPNASNEVPFRVRVKATDESLLVVLVNSVRMIQPNITLKCAESQPLRIGSYTQF